jgi:D-alanine-D-alanine ligase
LTESRPWVAVVYNEPCIPAGASDATSESEVVNVAKSVAAALDETGFEAILLPAAPPLGAFLEQLTSLHADIAFSLIEGFGGKSALSTHLTSIFELMNLPYTGAPVEGLVACQSKGRTKALLRGLGLPVTPSLVLGLKDPIPTSAWAGLSIVKPDAEDGSLGIDQQSVVEHSSNWPDLVERLRRQYGGNVLIEPYLPGPEFNVGVIADPDPRPLPVAQVMYEHIPGQWPILTYGAKWHEGSNEDLASPIACPAPITDELAQALGKFAVDAFIGTACRDYARVDFRLDDSGVPRILEVNPNPDLDPSAGWARAARVSGLSYAEAVARIATQALRRGSASPDNPPVEGV